MTDNLNPYKNFEIRPLSIQEQVILETKIETLAIKYVLLSLNVTPLNTLAPNYRADTML